MKFGVSVECDLVRETDMRNGNLSYGEFVWLFV